MQPSPVPETSPLSPGTRVEGKESRDVGKAETIVQVSDGKNRESRAVHSSKISSSITLRDHGTCFTAAEAAGSRTSKLCWYPCYHIDVRGESHSSGRPQNTTLLFLFTFFHLHDDLSFAH